MKTNLSFRDACKIKIAHILYFQIRGRREGGKNLIVSKTSKMGFFLVPRKKTSLIFGVFKRKVGGGAACELLRKDKI